MHIIEKGLEKASEFVCPLPYSSKFKAMAWIASVAYESKAKKQWINCVTKDKNTKITEFYHLLNEMKMSTHP